MDMRSVRPLVRALPVTLAAVWLVLLLGCGGADGLPARDDGPLTVRVLMSHDPDAAARLSLGPEWTVRPSRELRDKLTELLGQNSVRLLYAPGREMM